MTGHPPWPWRRILKLYLAALIMAEGAALPALLLAVSVIGGCVTDQMDYRHEWKP